MPGKDPTRWYHCNRYAADSACRYCGGVIRHDPWCPTQNAAVSYAYQIAMGSAELSARDGLILHALGVAWQPARCQRRRDADS